MDNTFLKKKKVAIIVRGPIRPDIDTVIKNIRLLKKSFLEFEVDVYLMAWNSIETSDFIIAKEVDNIILIKEPTTEFISEKLTTRTKQNSLFDRNYKAFWSVRTAIRIIRDTQINYDWIVLTRTDLEISIRNANKWMNDSLYTMPKQENYVINDQFGIAKPEVMYKAWDYIDLPTLNQLYGQSFNPEECLKKIMELNGVLIQKQKASHYELNLKRHFKENDYPISLLKLEIKNSKKINKLFVGKKYFIKIIKIIYNFYKNEKNKSHSV